MRISFPPYLVHALLFVLALAAAPLAAAVTLVSTTLTPIPGGDNVSTRALVLSDGKILVVGHARYGYRKFALTRYNADGSLDTTYGSQGTRLQAINNSDAEAWGAALQSDGKIVVAGHVTLSGTDRMAVVRFAADGSVDTPFGVRVVGAGPSHARAKAVAIQPDGKVVVGGYSMGPTGKTVMTLARLNADGSVDSTFAGGFYYSNEAVSSEMVTAIGFQSDGRIVATLPPAPATVTWRCAASTPTARWTRPGEVPPTTTSGRATTSWCNPTARSPSSARCPRGRSRRSPSCA
jgi:uncharacterized delta-60 repeat protein